MDKTEKTKKYYRNTRIEKPASQAEKEQKNVLEQNQHLMDTQYMKIFT